MAKQTACSKQCAIATQGAYQVGFIRQMMRCTKAANLVVGVDGKGELFMELSGRVGLENDVYGGVCRAYVGCELEKGLADVRRALLLGDEDVARWRGPLQAEKGVGRILFVCRPESWRQFAYVFDVETGGGRGEESGFRGLGKEPPWQDAMLCKLHRICIVGSIFTLTRWRRVSMEVQNVKSCESKGVGAVQAPCDVAERWCGVMAFVGKDMGHGTAWPGVIVACTGASPIARSCTVQTPTKHGRLFRHPTPHS